LPVAPHPSAADDVVDRKGLRRLRAARMGGHGKVPERLAVGSSGIVAMKADTRSTSGKLHGFLMHRRDAAETEFHFVGIEMKSRCITAWWIVTGCQPCSLLWPRLTGRRPLAKPD